MNLLLTPRELASLLSLKEQTIYNRHSNGASLPQTVKIGSRLRFRQSDVDAWIADRIERPSKASRTQDAATVTPSSGSPVKAQQIAERQSDLAATHPDDITD